MRSSAGRRADKQRRLDDDMSVKVICLHECMSAMNACSPSARKNGRRGRQALNFLAATFWSWPTMRQHDAPTE